MRKAPACIEYDCNETVLLTEGVLRSIRYENIQNLYLNQLSRKNSRAALRGDLTYPKYRLKQFSDGTFYSSIKIWNSIPLNLSNSS